MDFEAVKAKDAGATAFLSLPQPVFDTLATRPALLQRGEPVDRFQPRVAKA